jgi:2-alkenal reductase
MDLPPDLSGALVVSVSEDGPAQEAGVRGSDETITIAGIEIEIGGDVILAINDQRVLEMDDVIVYLVKEARPGQVVELTILREGQEHQIEVTLTERPSQP